MRTTPRLLAGLLLLAVWPAGACEHDRNGHQPGSGDAAPAADAAPDASFETYFEPCTAVPDSCPAPYRCTATEPAHLDHPVGTFCLLPCDEATYCGPWVTCLCKGLPGGGETDGPVPDGYCECG